MTHFKNTLIATSLVALTLSTNAFAFKLRHGNAEGGVTSSAGHVFQGANGGSFASGRRIRSDGAGDVSGGSAAAGITANGGQFKRAGAFSRSADGSASRQGGMEASGEKGSISSSGSATKTADGTINESRSTQTTNAQTGITRDGDTSYASGQGVTHSATCTNSSGASVACPTH